MRRLYLLAAMAAAAHGEIHTLSLKQVVDRALTQNPEIVIARLEQQKAADAVGLAKDPFSPHLNVGSGIAYSNGFPLSIEGSAPAVFQAKANQSLFNRPQTWALAQARENARAAAFASGTRRDDVIYRVVTLYIDVDRAGRLSEAAGKQADSLQKVLESAEARVQAGRDLPIVRQEAGVNLLRARQRLLTSPPIGIMASGTLPPSWASPLATSCGPRRKRVLRRPFPLLSFPLPRRRPSRRPWRITKN